jgi:hypothetical protein
MSIKRKLTFSVSRTDLLYDFASSFSDVFSLRIRDGEVFETATGVRLQEEFGFDFQNETNPTIRIAPFQHVIREKLNAEPDDFSVYITLEDTALGIRKNILQKDVSEINEPIEHKIDLKLITDLGFTRGYNIRGIIARRNSIDPDKDIIWSKSHIIHQAEFTVKASVNEALFEINWLIFKNEEYRKNVLLYVDWKSGDITHSPHSDCFQIVANNDLRAQFKRLENNRHFGHFAIKLIADRIIAELAENALRFADLSSEPLLGSLHDKISELFDGINLDFNELSKKYQYGDQIDKVVTTTEVNKAIQNSHALAVDLKGIKFGGYR